MDDDISYADNVVDREPELDTAEQAGSVSLKERIGNRIYLLEDSRKRKLVDIEETTTDEVENTEGPENADLTHRSNAILLQGPPISQLPTARVFAYATHFDAHPIGLEWVDDQTCVLVFTSRKHALQAWDALRRPLHAGASATTMQIENSEMLFVAPPLPLALYPIEERINSVLGTQKSAALKETINIRWARPSDVKQPGARVRSEFYKKHGDMAGKESLPGGSLFKRRRYDGDTSDTRRKLDAELDSFLGDGDEEVSANLRSRPGEKGRQSRDEETRRQLDEELDSFLAQDSGAIEADEGGTEPQTKHLEKRSLMDRTRPLPRRRRGREARIEGENGRWLHNAEIMRRQPRREYDKDWSGMRAWREDAGNDQRPATSGRSRRPHKTQEELDRELEDFLAA